MRRTAAHKTKTKTRKDVLRKYPFVDDTSVDEVLYNSGENECQDLKYTQSLRKTRRPVPKVVVADKSRMIQAFKRQKDKEQRRRFQIMEQDMQKLREDKLKDKLKERSRVLTEIEATRQGRQPHVRRSKLQAKSRAKISPQANKFNHEDPDLRDIINHFYQDPLLRSLLVKEPSDRPFDIDNLVDRSLQHQ